MTMLGIPPVKKLLAASVSSLCQSPNPQVNLLIPRPHYTLNSTRLSRLTKAVHEAREYLLVAKGKVVLDK